MERGHRNGVASDGDSGKRKMRDVLFGFAREGKPPMPGDGGGSNGRVLFWVNRMVGVACGAVLAVAAWKGLRGMEFRSLFRLPVTPVLGEAGYAMRMVGTIEELIEREELRGGYVNARLRRIPAIR